MSFIDMFPLHLRTVDCCSQQHWYYNEGYETVWNERDGVCWCDTFISHQCGWCGHWKRNLWIEHKKHLIHVKSTLLMLTEKWLWTSRLMTDAVEIRSDVFAIQVGNLLVSFADTDSLEEPRSRSMKAFVLWWNVSFMTDSTRIIIAPLHLSGFAISLTPLETLTQQHIVVIKWCIANTSSLVLSCLCCLNNTNSSFSAAIA